MSFFYGCNVERALHIGWYTVVTWMVGPRDMTRELEKADWQGFFERLSRELDNWETTVHVLNINSGAQILSDRLPFHGLRIKDVSGRESIGLSVGNSAEAKDTLTILSPTKVVFAERGRGPAGTLDIEDATGTTTLITFVQPQTATGLMRV